MRTTLVTVVIAIALLAALEIALRIAYPGDVAIAGSLGPIAYVFNPDYGVSLKPDQHKFFARKPENGGYIVQWRTNSAAFRGEPLHPDPSYRVLVYGDSNIQARFSGQQRSFTGQLASILEKQLAGEGIAETEVINAGLVGAGPDQSLIRFTLQSDQLKPDLVIFHIFADNDLGDIIRNRLFELDDNGALQRSSHAVEPDDDLLQADRHRLRDFVSRLLVVKKTKALLQHWTGWPKHKHEQQAAANKQRSLAERRQYEVDFLLERARQEFAVYEARAARKFSHFSDHYDYDSALFPDQPSSREKLRLMEAILARAYQHARDRGIQFLVLIQPSVIDLTLDNALVNREFLSQYPDYRPETLSSSIEQVCKRNGIPVLNLMENFRDHEPATLYFTAGDDHWSDHGQELAAQLTARYLLDTGMLPTAALP